MNHLRITGHLPVYLITGGKIGLISMSALLSIMLIFLNYMVLIHSLSAEAAYQRRFQTAYSPLAIFLILLTTSKIAGVSSSKKFAPASAGRSALLSPIQQTWIMRRKLFLQRILSISNLPRALTATNSPTVDELANGFSAILDQDIYKLYATYQKPIILGVNSYSLDGSASNCLSSNTTCSNLKNGSVDVNEQADVYQAILKASVLRPWIYGLVSTGFNPAAAVQDGSASVNGKPSIQVLSYYFNNLK